MVRYELTNQDKIRILYNLLLCREPESNGLNLYSSALDTGNYSFQEIFDTIDNSPERANIIKSDQFKRSLLPTLPIDLVIYIIINSNLCNLSVNILIIEILIALYQDKKAIALFKNLDDYTNMLETIRIVKLSSITDYIAYTWLYRKAANIYPSVINEPVISSQQLNDYLNEISTHPKGNYDPTSIPNSIAAANSISSRLIEEVNPLADSELKKYIDLIFSLSHIPNPTLMECYDVINCILTMKSELPTHTQQNITILNAGFLHSGSSAIYDWLRGALSCNDVCNPKYAPINNTREFAIIHAKRGFSELMSQIHLAPPTFKLRSIQFFLIYCLGLFSSNVNFAKWFKYNNLYYDAFCYSDKLFSRYLSLFKQFFLHINAIYKNQLDIDSYNPINTLLSSIASTINGRSSKYHILDNAIPCDCISYINKFPKNTIYIFTVRDPRDMFLSWQRYQRYTPRDFIECYKYKLSLILKTYSDLSPFYHFIPIRYEEFITKTSYRNRLKEKLKIDEVITSSYFCTEKSKQHIGKWRKYGDQTAINNIYNAFPELYNNIYCKLFHENIE